MGANLEKLQQANGPINGESGREYSVSIPSLEDSIREKLNTLPPSLDELCIYRVSEILRKASESSYSPQLVSIGPFHRDNKNLGKMDVHKRRYLKTYLDSYCQINLQSCLQNLRDLEGRTRKCYVEHISLNSDQFVEMMLFDGVFIIMFLLKFYSPEIGDEDPIIKNMSMSGAIQYDMILLENQLPFFVLDHLFSLAQVSGQYSNFFQLTIELLRDLVKENTIQGGNIDGSQVKHILDLLRSCCIPSSLRPIRNVPYSRHSTVTELHYSRLSVTELHDVGVKFKAGVSGSSCLLDVKFTNGVLKIQPLRIQDRTESLFRNLIALEQCHYPESAYVTGYALFMGYLINTPKDAGILIDHEIIKNYLGNHEDVSTFINNLSKHVVLDNTSSYFEYQELDEYCKKSLHRWSTSFRRTYYGSPIIIISTIAAILLLGLTVIQAICSIISVKVPKKS
ncbi:hypothetical protein HHK36_020033 [Tetracentron sinense]|uniref:Uncharacterized protein n=1 Tax=Tetracentron sinense TaxID=13715 RepID=A0A834YUD3_TETSI|nr:hypothetical protein HHK36_020033 [Tetracentron sinense]